MRVIAGRLGGRGFETPRRKSTHPMSDKIRGAIFNMLGDITGLTVLDAFAGSGALAIEAISRGARSAVAVEIDSPASQTVMRNCKALGIGSSVSVLNLNVLSWSREHQYDRFDLVFADPPYDNVQTKVLQQLVKNIARSGLFVVSWPGKISPPNLDGLILVAHKTYGDASLYVYNLQISDPPL